VSSRSESAGFQIGPGMWAKLRVWVKDEEGTKVQDEPTEAGFLIGYGTLLPALEDALLGSTAGSRRQVTLKPADAFGERDPKALLEVLRDEFPDDVAPGDVFDAEEDPGAQGPGGMVLLRVLEVTPESVVLDRNHPLSGQRVTFDVEVLEVRPGEDAEIAEAESALSEGRPEDPSIIPAARLLRGGPQRYEKGPPGTEPGSRR